MPKSRRNRSRSRSTRPSMPGTVSASRCTLTRRTVGTTHWVTAMPRAAKPDHQPEDARHAHPSRNDRADHERDHEREPDGDADRRHGLGAALLAREVGHHGEDHRTHRAGALQHAADDDPVDGGGERRDRAAEREQGEADDHHHLAPDAVRQEAEGNLQKPLAQPVDAEREADLGRRRTLQPARVGREHRIDHEQAEQPYREHGSEGKGGAGLLTIHLYGSLVSTSHKPDHGSAAAGEHDMPAPPRRPGHRFAACRTTSHLLRNTGFGPAVMMRPGFT